MTSPIFSTLRRQQFRTYFQPSRIVLGIVPAECASGVNIITLCFNMYCSYKPPMMAVAIHNRSATYHLIQRCDSFVLSVPGESLVDAAMFCGIESMKSVDKVKALGLHLIGSQTIDVPGLGDAIANAEMTKVSAQETGDHLLVVGRVSRFAVDTRRKDLPLLSIGPCTDGYKLLRQKGVHRLGVAVP
jgi:flavin reductase (DIM6/NTAB) family NADH-FMN oxidoreductase RutF